MKKSFAILSVAVAAATTFSFASCGRAGKLKKADDEKREEILNEYQEKYLAALSDVLYVKDYARITSSVKKDETSFSFASTLDTDYAFSKTENGNAISALAAKTTTETKTNADSSETYKNVLSVYLDEKGTYTCSESENELSKTFYESGSFFDSIFRSLTPSDAFELYTLISRDHISDWTANDGNVEIYSYSDALGSGFKMSCTLDATSDATEIFEGAENFFELLGEVGAELKMTLSMSMFFDSTGGLDYTETTMKLSFSPAENKDEENSGTENTDAEGTEGEYRYYQKTTVQSSSTVKYPADLSDYSPEK